MTSAFEPDDNCHVWSFLTVSCRGCRSTASHLFSEGQWRAVWGSGHMFSLWTRCPCAFCPRKDPVATAKHINKAALQNSSRSESGRAVWRSGAKCRAHGLLDLRHCAICLNQIARCHEVDLSIMWRWYTACADYNKDDASAMGCNRI